MNNQILHFLSTDTIFFTFFGYQMSYVEFFGTIFTLFSVWLVAKKHILNWPVGIVGTVLFGALFYQIHLYADLFEQAYYLITGFIGWYVWTVDKKPRDRKDLIVVTRMNRNEIMIWVAAVLLFSIVGAWALTNIHIWLPSFFPIPASLPFLDVTTTVMSFVATILLVKKRLESWIIWIVVDVIAIGLYWYKGVPFIALLYVIFLGLATYGFIDWRRTYRKELGDEKRTSNREVLPTT